MDLIVELVCLHDKCGFAGNEKYFDSIDTLHMYFPLRKQSCAFKRLLPLTSVFTTVRKGFTDSYTTLSPD